MSMNDILCLSMFGIFVILLFSGYPIAYVLGGVGIFFAGIGYLSDSYLGTATGLDFMTIGLVVNRIFTLASSYLMVAVPMFIFMGLMLNESTIAEKMLDSMQRLFGSLHGGMAITVTAIGVILAASTGIIAASVVLLGMLSLVPMLQQGYKKELALGTICAAGTLGILIPPSVMLVIMGDQLAISVGDLFMGALIPGLILSALYFIYIVVICRIKPEYAPLPPNREKLTLRALIGVLNAVLLPALLILAVLGSIFSGIATPTEASGIGALGSLLLALYLKKLALEVLKKVCIETLRTTGFIFSIFMGATCFALVLRELGGDEMIERFLLGLPFGSFGILATVLIIVFFLGFFLDWIEITFIILPLVAPVISKLDWSIVAPGVSCPEIVWFAVLVAVTLQTSFLTPPVGFALFFLKGVSPPEIDLIDIYRGIIPFVILQLIGLVTIIIFPQLVTWLPSVAY
jgi:tripartite ATP-independent transporter DctM subunit